MITIREYAEDDQEDVCRVHDLARPDEVVHLTGGVPILVRILTDGDHACYSEYEQQWRRIIR